MVKKSEQKIIVAPQSYVSLSEIAIEVRKMAKKLGFTQGPYFDVVRFYEYFHSKIPEKFQFHIVDQSELPDQTHEGLTKPNGEILIPEDVYHGALDDDGRPRFTMSHELGHWLLHRESFGFARANQNVPRYQCPEWQANTFGSFVLMPVSAVIKSNQCPNALIERCKVSYAAAKVRCDIYEERKI